MKYGSKLMSFFATLYARNNRNNNKGENKRSRINAWKTGVLRGSLRFRFRFQWCDRCRYFECINSSCIMDTIATTTTTTTTTTNVMQISIQSNYKHFNINTHKRKLPFVSCCSANLSVVAFQDSGLHCREVWGFYNT